MNNGIDGDERVSVTEIKTAKFKQTENEIIMIVCIKYSHDRTENTHKDLQTISIA